MLKLLLSGARWLLKHQEMLGVDLVSPKAVAGPAPACAPLPPVHHSRASSDSDPALCLLSVYTSTSLLL